jgi:hypothetical protein
LIGATGAKCSAHLAGATLPAIAFLVVVHGTVLSGLTAVRLVRRKRYRANRCDQNRKENFCAIFHNIYFGSRCHTALVENEVKYWEIIADNLSKAGWSWGCVSALDSNRSAQIVI